jgi:hypothetical protein
LHRAPSCGARNRSHFIARDIVPGKYRRQALQYQAFFRERRNPLNPWGVSYRGTAPRDKIHASIRFPRKLHPETFQMVLTSVHIQPIVALIAGIIILIMPRFLNLIVAIYLIVTGLIGLGVLKMLHI